MEKVLKRVYEHVPSSIRPTIREAYFKVVENLPWTKEGKKKRWERDYYLATSKQNREYLFLQIARFCNINRPIDGYYFEFGCHGGNTMRLAYKHFQHLFDWKYVAFDSFEGLPEIEKVDEQEIWEKGKLSTAEEEFIDIVCSGGMPREKLRTVKGFYDQSLTPELQKEFIPEKAAVIYVDCDLYKSTVPVLTWIRPFIQPGTVIVFDDWNCFLADPDKGERRAFKEFLDQHPDLHVEELASTGEGKAFVFVR